MNLQRACARQSKQGAKGAGFKEALVPWGSAESQSPLKVCVSGPGFRHPDPGPEHGALKASHCPRGYLTPLGKGEKLSLPTIHCCLNLEKGCQQLKAGMKHAIQIHWAVSLLWLPLLWHLGHLKRLLFPLAPRLGTILSFIYSFICILPLCISLGGSYYSHTLFQAVEIPR